MARKLGRPFLYSVLCSLGILVVLLGAVFGTLFWNAQQGAHAANLHGSSVIQASVLPMHPLYKMAVKMGAGGTANKLMGCLNRNAAPVCYSPQQFRQAYAIQPLLNAGITGKGRIITIIDAFQDPTIRTELHLFDTLFGLQDPQLNIIAPFGLTPFNPKDPAQTGFAGEIALDVEWAHAIAPGATLDLVLANVKDETIQGQVSALLQTTKFAVARNIGSVISQSFGISETCINPAFVQQAHAIFRAARVQQQTVFASAGDSGSAAIQCNAKGQLVALARGINYPASDPLVTSVGGTTLFAAKNGTYLGERAWNESQKGAGATGGGVSKIFAQPAFQNKVINSAMRSVTDISFDADPLTGIPVVTSSLMPGQTVLIPIGGTSVGSPVAAGMTALFDQANGGKRLGFLNAALYRLNQQAAAYAQAFHDVKTGNNTFAFLKANKLQAIIPGFTARPGWDQPTGLGTPNVANLAKLLPRFITAKDGADL